MNKTTLPISDFKEEITKAVAENAVTIITAQTGSGKSTQVPQYLYEAGYEVVITEPRRMAACSLASRVAEEMDAQLGETVGYRTGFERKDSPNTSILFCTDGLELVRELAEANNTTGKKKVLIIDEVHEWNLNIETLIAWSKKKVCEGWNTKVVIMSATLEKEKISNFFLGNSKTLDIPGKLFPVDVEERFESRLISSIMEMISKNKNTLVFVAGKPEIEKVTNDLKETYIGIGCSLEQKAVVLSLHGEMNYEDQKNCFETYSLPKVVIATNVAQTSVTIPDIDCVIDTGKEKRIEVRNGIQGLFIKNVSKADCLQRKGRAGRTKEGKYILCSNTLLNEREEYAVAEIQRCFLDQVVLRLATCGIDATSLEFFHQPSLEALEYAKKSLVDLGAMVNNNVTPIGYKMAKMPVSVVPARMIVEAEKYGVTKDVIAISAILQNGSLLDRKEGCYFMFSKEKESDLLAELDVWRALEKERWIDFDKLKINKKIYFKVKEYIKKIEEVLSNTVDITTTGNRKDVKKCIIVGMIGNLYKYDGLYWNEDNYVNKDNNYLNYLSKNTCISEDDYSLFVGNPMVIEFKDKNYGFNRTMKILTMVTGVKIDELCELFPEDVTQKYVEPDYSCYSDAVKVKEKVYFKEFVIKESYEILQISEHPEYKEAKEEYDKARKERMTYSYSIPKMEERQAYVTVAGKSFKVEYMWNDDCCITIDEETLYSAEESTIHLDNGKTVTICFSGSWKKAKSISELRNIVERERIKDEWNVVKNNLPKIKDSKLSSILEAFPEETKILVTNGNGGRGEAIYGYICIDKDKNSLYFDLLEDEEIAKAKTADVVEWLYDREISTNYVNNKFRVKKSKKNIDFTPKEQAIRDEFYSEVRELSKGLEIGNIVERLMYLEELYNALVEDLF